MKRKKNYVEPEVEETLETEVEPAKVLDETEKADLTDASEADEDEAATPAEESRQPYDGNTAFHLYLREVGQSKLLTRRKRSRWQSGSIRATPKRVKR